MNVGKRQRKQTPGLILIQTIEITIHPEIARLAEIFKARFGTAESFGAGHLADYLFNPPAIFFKEGWFFRAQLRSPFQG
jgi:hypothetical protein